jgi:hypothetical protein
MDDRDALARDALARTHAYMAAQVTSHALLEHLKDWLAGHKACSIAEGTQWEHVADVQRLQQGLEALISDMRTL